MATRKKKKILKKVRYITIICAIILIVEILFVMYSLLFKNKESLYFDGINALITNDSYYVTVGSNNDNSNHYEKAKVSKHNRKKEKTFEKLYNVGYNSAFFGVSMDEDNIVAVGSYEKTADDHNDSVRRALIVKYDSLGEIIFAEDFKLLDNSKFTSVTTIEDGYLVTGQSVYKNTKVGTKEGGAILAKYDKEGNLVWYKTYGSSKSAIFNDLLITNDAIYTVGMDTNYLGVICKYDFNGNLISSNTYKSTDEVGFSGITSVEGNIYVSGAKKLDSNDTQAMIVEYDLDCGYINDISYQGEGYTKYSKLAVDKHNNIIAIGIRTTNKNTNSKEKTAESINYDGIIGKYKTDLKEVDVITYGDERDDYFTDIQVNNNEYLVVGYSSYEDGSYLSKFIRYSDALKVLEVES